MKVEVAIINALKSVGMPSNITEVLADGDGVTPAAPYLILQVISTDTVSMPTKTTTHKVGQQYETVFITKDFNYSLIFHAKRSDPTFDWVERFYSGLETDMFDWAFVQQGLGIVRTGGITYQPQPVQGNNYRRAILDITFRAEEIQEYTVNVMTGIDVEGDLIDTRVGNIGEVVVNVDFNE